MHDSAQIFNNAFAFLLLYCRINVVILASAVKAAGKMTN